MCRELLDPISSWILLWTVDDKLLKVLAVVREDTLGVG
jgi:hypothetical protein